MRRAGRKHNYLKYKFLYFQIAIAILLFMMYIFANAPELLILIHRAKLLPILKTLFGILIAYVAGPLLVIYLVRRAFLEHKGITAVNWRSYLNDSLYNDFCSQPSDIEPDDVVYWKTQEIIAQKRAANGGGLDYAFTGQGANPDDGKSGNTRVVAPESQPADLPVNDEPVADVPETDPLEDIPKFDPNGPNPFKQG